MKEKLSSEEQIERVGSASTALAIGMSATKMVQSFLNRQGLDGFIWMFVLVCELSTFAAFVFLDVLRKNKDKKKGK